MDYKEIVKEEIKKCILSPAYFCKTYCYIIHQEKGKILFDLYPFQDDVLLQFQQNKRVIILKSRQLGISTLCAAYSLWLTLFNPAKNVLFVSKRQKDATGLIDKVRVMYIGLPSWLKKFADTITEDNKQSIAFNNNSRIAAESTTADTGRSTSNALVILDEFAFAANGSPPQQKKLLASVLQSASANTSQVIILSTPNGQEHFHATWVKAVAGENPFKPIRLPWTVHPEHDQKWRNEQTKELGEKLAAQECLGEDTKITIREIETKKIKKLTLGELYTSFKYNVISNKVKKNSIYEILTPSGYQKFYGIKKNIKQKYLELTFSNKSIVNCSLEHPFFQNNEKILANKLNIGDIIDGKRKIKIKDKKEIKEEITLYDIIEVNNGHRFYINNDIISSNCDTDFATSGANVIDLNLIKQYNSNFVREPILKKGPGNNLWIWALPVPGTEYIIPADVARGDGSDYSGCHVMSKEDVEQVAEFKMQLGTREYAQFLFNLGIEYNNALLVVENASMGWDVVQELINLGYPNLYYSNPALLFSSTNNNFIPFDGHAKTVPGFTNSMKTRPMIIAKLEAYFSEQACIYHSERLDNELKVFIWLKGKAQAQQGYNDDLVIPWATGLFIRDTFSKLNRNNLELQSAMINSIGTSVSSGMHEMDRNRIMEKNYTMSTGRGDSESIEWLLDNPRLDQDDKKEKSIAGLIWIG